jgi:hypothetical protein
MATDQMNDLETLSSLSGNGNESILGHFGCNIRDDPGHGIYGMQAILFILAGPTGSRYAGISPIWYRNGNTNFMVKSYALKPFYN